MSHCFSGIDTG